MLIQIGDIKYVFVDNVKEKGAGPGYSLLCCEKYLQVPFILTSVDTLVKKNTLYQLIIG